MKITIAKIMLMVFCLTVSAQLVIPCNGSGGVQNVGGDFGRAWLADYLAKNPRPVTENSNSTTSNNSTADWGGAPKGTAEVKSNLVNQQQNNAQTNNWLGDSDVTGTQTSQTNTQNGAAQPLFDSETLHPVHKIGASPDQNYDQSSGMPQPDANGLINGLPAELYYSIGPALYTF